MTNYSSRLVDITLASDINIVEKFTHMRIKDLTKLNHKDLIIRVFNEKKSIAHILRCFFSRFTKANPATLHVVCNDSVTVGVVASYEKGFVVFRKDDMFSYGNETFADEHLSLICANVVA